MSGQYHMAEKNHSDHEQLALPDELPHLQQPRLRSMLNNNPKNLFNSWYRQHCIFYKPEHHWKPKARRKCILPWQNHLEHWMSMYQVLYQYLHKMRVHSGNPVLDILWFHHRELEIQMEKFQDLQLRFVWIHPMLDHYHPVVSFYGYLWDLRHWITVDNYDCKMAMPTVQWSTNDPRVIISTIRIEGFI